MGKLNVWAVFEGDEAEQWRQPICAALSDAGVSVHPYQEHSNLSGIVCSGRFNEGLRTVLESTSVGGSRRVLAIGLCARSNGHDSVDVDASVWPTLCAGASDFILWQEPQHSVQQVVARLERWRRVDELLGSSLVKEHLVGESRIWRDTLRQVIEVAHFTQNPALILGESGTGKELVARLMHTMDSRPDKGELIVVDCTNIAQELAGSELFGHERGAFTGATAARDGACRLANKGTLFLDEVGELPLSLQAQLLRVIQEHTYKPVGGNRWLETDFRLVCATNRDLQHEVAAGRFRGDLYFRIASWVFRLPPLRERPEDILPLARHFLERQASAGECPVLDAAVSSFLLARPYPGNIRELEHVVSRIRSRHVGGGPITAGAVPADEWPRPGELPLAWRHGFDRAVRGALTQGIGLKEICDQAKDSAIRLVVDHEHGNLQRAARKLGVTDRSLQMWRANKG